METPFRLNSLTVDLHVLREVGSLNTLQAHADRRQIR